jgi:hypothetical protein
MRHLDRLQNRKNKPFGSSDKLWEQYERIDGDLKEEVKDIFSSMTKFTVDCS